MKKKVIQTVTAFNSFLLPALTVGELSISFSG